MNIVFKTDKIRVQKTQKLIESIGFSKSPKTQIVTIFNGQARVAYPYTFGFLKHWVSHKRKDTSVEAATASASELLFRNKYLNKPSKGKMKLEFLNMGSHKEDSYIVNPSTKPVELTEEQIKDREIINRVIKSHIFEREKVRKEFSENSSNN
jgi:hypothetical protein